MDNRNEDIGLGRASSDTIAEICKVVKYYECFTCHVSVSPVPATIYIPLIEPSICITFTISTDDPPLFYISLNEELLCLANEFHIATKDIDTILLNGFRANFLPEQRRQAMEQKALTKLAVLKKKYLMNLDE